MDAVALGNLSSGQAAFIREWVSLVAIIIDIPPSLLCRLPHRDRTIIYFKLLPPSLLSIALGGWSQLQLQSLICIKMMLKLWKKRSGWLCGNYPLLQNLHKMDLVRMMQYSWRRRGFEYLPRLSSSHTYHLSIEESTFDEVFFLEFRINVKLAQKSIWRCYYHT